MKTQVSTESLRNYFAGLATALQKQVIDEWAKDSQNREVFFEYLAAWEIQNIQFIANVDAAEKRHQQRITQQYIPYPSLFSQQRRRTYRHSG